MVAGWYCKFVLLSHDKSPRCWSRLFDCSMPVFFSRWGRLDPVQHYVWRWSAVIGAFRSGYCFSVRSFPQASADLPRIAGFYVFWLSASTLPVFRLRCSYWCCSGCYKFGWIVRHEVQLLINRNYNKIREEYDSGINYLTGWYTSHSTLWNIYILIFFSWSTQNHSMSF